METFAGGTLLKMRSSKTYRTYCGVRNPSTASRMFLPKKPRSDPAVDRMLMPSANLAGQQLSRRDDAVSADDEPYR